MTVTTTTIYDPIPSAHIHELVKIILSGDDAMAKSAILERYGNLEDWNTSEVENMANLFANKPFFNRDISRWDTGRVTNMNRMFCGAACFNAPIGKWNVSRVKGMGLMFYDATSFNQPLGEWDVSSVTIATDMFRGATSFHQSLSSWKLPEGAAITNMLTCTPLQILGSRHMYPPCRAQDAGIHPGSGVWLYNRPIWQG